MQNCFSKHYVDILKKWHLVQIFLCCQVPFSIQLCAFRVLPFPASLVILFQYPFEIWGLVKDLSGKLRVGDDPPIAIVLQGAGALVVFVVLSDFTQSNRSTSSRL